MWQNDEVPACKAAHEDVPYGPGDSVLFFQHLIHNIATPKVAKAAKGSGKAAKGSGGGSGAVARTVRGRGTRPTRPTVYRLIHAVWITPHATAPFDYTETIRTQGVPVLKSGQKSPMYAANHLLNWQDKPFTLRERKDGSKLKLTLSEWSVVSLQPCFLKEHVRGGQGPHAGEKSLIVHRYMPSLAEVAATPLGAACGIKMYRDYTAEELAVFTPARSFMVRTFDDVTGAAERVRSMMASMCWVSRSKCSRGA